MSSTARRVLLVLGLLAVVVVAAVVVAAIRVGSAIESAGPVELPDLCGALDDTTLSLVAPSAGPPQSQVAPDLSSCEANTDEPGPGVDMAVGATAYRTPAAVEDACTRIEAEPEVVDGTTRCRSERLDDLQSRVDAVVVVPVDDARVVLVTLGYQSVPARALSPRVTDALDELLDRAVDDVREQVGSG